MKIGLAGDTMLGRKVAERLGEGPPTSLLAAGANARKETQWRWS